VIAVASGKGGTGKSLLAVNLAVALAERMQVCLIDADFGLANAHILMGLLPRHDVSHLVSGESPLAEVVLQGPRGVQLLPGASGVPEMAHMDDSSLLRFATLAAPLLGACDTVVLDCPAGLSRHSLVFLHGADVVVVVTTEELTSMTDAYALIKTLVMHRPGAAVGLVVNDARSPSEGAETYRKISHVARKFLGRAVPSLGTIPRDPQLERSVMERRPVVLGHPSASSSRAIADLARRIEEIDGPAPVTAFTDRLQDMIAPSVGSRARLRGAHNGDNPCAP
jgi:flagellar biosynthesis protein FlhG